MAELLHPELLTAIPLVGNKIGSTMEDRLAEVGAFTVRDPDLSIVIRTLNESNQLRSLLQDVDAQQYAGNQEIIVVDNESSDDTVAVANNHGARVVNLPRKQFTYPIALNRSMEAASHDLVFITVGHARLSNRILFHAGARHFTDPNVGAVFARVLPNDNASLPERLIAMGNLAYLRPPQDTRKAKLGVLASQNAMVSKPIWQNLGRFDENYEAGGADTALAGKMLKHGLRVIEDPALAVHHTHGLNWINTAKQWRAWIGMARGPSPFDKEKLAKRRPDLNFD